MVRVIERLSERITPWLADAIAVHALGERVTWDVALTVVPTEQGPTPMLMIYLEIPAAVLGEYHSHVSLMPPHGLTQLGIEQTVKAGVGQLLDVRSRALSNGATR